MDRSSGTSWERQTWFSTRSSERVGWSGIGRQTRARWAYSNQWYPLCSNPQARWNEDTHVRRLHFVAFQRTQEHPSGRSEDHPWRDSRNWENCEAGRSLWTLHSLDCAIDYRRRWYDELHQEIIDFTIVRWRLTKVQWRHTDPWWYPHTVARWPRCRQVAIADIHGYDFTTWSIHHWWWDECGRIDGGCGQRRIQRWSLLTRSRRACVGGHGPLCSWRIRQDVTRRSRRYARGHGTTAHQHQQRRN